MPEARRQPEPVKPKRPIYTLETTGLLIIALLVLIPGGKIGVWIAGGLGFLVVLLGIVLSFIPPGETENKLLFEVKLASGTALAVFFGIWLYSRGARARARQPQTVGLQKPS